MYRVSQNSNPKNNVNFENTDFIKIMLILGHPVHGILNLTSKSDSATSNYYTYRFLSIYLNFNTNFSFGILTNSKTTFFQFLMLFLGHPVHGILNLTSKSDSATSNYYMYRFSSIYVNFNIIFFFGILTNSKITFFQFWMLFLGHPVYEIAKSG